MKYDAFQQIIDTMRASNYDYEKEIEEIEKKQNAFKVANCEEAGLSAHIRAMIYALLSNNRKWEPIAENSELIDKIFGNYDPVYLKNTNPQIFINKIKEIRCGNRQINNQMRFLKVNIETLEKIEREHGSINNYFKKEDEITIIKSLSDYNGNYKLKWMGIPLVCEYVKGFGIEVVKPDSLIRRLVTRLGYSNKKLATEWETIDICKEIGKEYGMKQILVDTILWQYCAKDKFELCTAEPKCDQCKVVNCKYKTAR